jgi:hypothetical protein
MKDKSTDAKIEFHPDAWKRFERAAARLRKARRNIG